MDDEKIILNYSNETNLDTSNSRIGYLVNVLSEKSRRFKSKIGKKTQDQDIDIFFVLLMILFYLCMLLILAIIFKYA